MGVREIDGVEHQLCDDSRKHWNLELYEVKQSKDTLRMEPSDQTLTAGVKPEAQSPVP